MQVKVAPRQRLRCGSSFFLVKMSPQACSESQKQWLDIERGESKTNWWVSGERGEDMDGSVCVLVAMWENKQQGKGGREGSA